MALRKLAVDIMFDSDIGKLMAVDSAVDEISESAVGAGSSIDGLSSASETTSSNMLSNFTSVGESMQGVGKKMSLGITAPLVAIGTAAIHTVAGFDDSMSKVKAISGATGKEFDELRETAIELGSTTAHSASAAADGMTIFATAGWETNQILEGTPNLLSLASASGLELAQSAEIMTNTMGQFSLEAEQSGMVADMFAKAASSSETNVAELGEAMKMGGGSAANMNMDLAQTNAVLGTFAGNGLKGSAAGTAFTAMFNDLSKGAEDGAVSIGDASVAVYDAGGTMRDMGSILADVESATDGMSDATKDAALQNIFGTQSMRGVNAMLVEGSASYNELEASIYDSEGAAAQMSDVMEDNLAGAFRGMGSALEGFMIQIGDQLKPIVESAANFIGDMALKFSELEDSTKRNIVIFGGILAAVGPLLLFFGKMLTMISPVVGIFTKMAGAVKGAGGAMALLTNPIGIAVVAIGLIVGAVVLAYNKIEWFRDAVNVAWDWIKESTSIAFEWIREIISTVMNSIMEFVGGILDSLTAFWSEHGEFILSLVQDKFISIMGTIQMVMGIIQGIFEVVWPIISGIVQIAWGVIQTVIQTAIDIVLGIISVAMSLLQGDWEGAWNAIKGIADSIWRNIVSFFQDVDLYQIGADILQGLIDGIGSMASAVWGKVTEIGSGIADKFKSVLSIFSPSRLFKGFGIDTMIGYTIGFEDEGKNAIDASESAALDIADAFKIPDELPDFSSHEDFGESNDFPDISIDEDSSPMQQVSSTDESTQPASTWIDKLEFNMSFPEAKDVEGVKEVVERTIKNLLVQINAGEVG